MIWIYVLVGVAFILFASGIRIIRPVEKGVVERLGKFRAIREQGFHWIIPVIDRMTKINITENMVDVLPQTVITKDKLNTVVDAVIYYKIIDTKKALYNVDDYAEQLVSLARTTLRAVIGKMTLTQANENRNEINSNVEHILDKETKSYGVDILRVELQKIDPPQDVQESMNKVVKAEQEKIAANDIATATETKADGERRAQIKMAEGGKQALILQAEGKAQQITKVADATAQKIKVVNEAIQKHFKGKAVDYKALETTERSLQNGTKYVIDSKSNIMNVITEAAGVIPVKNK